MRLLCVILSWHCGREGGSAHLWRLAERTEDRHDYRQDGLRRTATGILYGASNDRKYASSTVA